MLATDNVINFNLVALQTWAQLTGYCSSSNFCALHNIFLIKLMAFNNLSFVCQAYTLEIIINEVCPSAMETEDILILCDPDKTSGDVELFFNAAQQNLTL